MPQEIMALQPAPVQAYYLGYHQSLQAPYIPYTFSDGFISTDNNRSNYSEALIQLPHCALINSSMPASNKKFGKGDFGISEESFVFCNLSFHKKITPLDFDLWMNILEQVKGAVLCLCDGGASLAGTNFKKEAQLRSVDPQRIIVLNKIPMHDHWARYQVCDLFLDTQVFNAHTVAVEALRQGVPVLTLVGETHNARLGGSLVKAAGLEELICYSKQEYVKKAVRLATDQYHFNEIRQRSNRNLTSTPLFDTSGSVKNLEKAYQKMWKIYQRNDLPHSFSVSSHRINN